jgi:hypothetical protein
LAQKDSHRNNSTSDLAIELAIAVLSSNVVNKGIIQEDVMGLAVAVLDTAAKE